MGKSTQIRDEVKSFKDLTIEVQDRGICGKCGGCVSFCSAGEFNALRMEEDGTPRLVDEEKCVKCGICYLICPQIIALNHELDEKMDWKPPIGPFRKLVSARTTSPEIMEVCTDGGVVTSLLTYALEKNLIQAAIVSRRVGPFTRQPMVVTKPEDLIEAAGSHFEETFHLDEIGKRYSSFVPSVRDIRTLGERNLDRIALVGTPCQVYAFRKMQLLRVVPSDTIALTIGLFCMENFSFDEKARKKLEKNIGIKLKNIRKLNIKDNVIVTQENGEVVHVPFEAVDELARPACFACSDFACDYADISCGGLGSPDGYTTTMVRTGIGEKVFNGAKQEKYIREWSPRDKEKYRIHKTEMMAKIVSFALRKKNRAKRTLGE
ncbi:Coenzyme F420 hydrogenase/dehydrogenase, beta subunit C-terminal domain [bacterium]|nr:Coenzyme F420 hydrogenase/dehydrogenase, beta subunit C-terminal domain [bacterium]